MIVIANSGTTKTNWRLVSPEKIKGKTQTFGLNPLLTTGENFKSIIQSSEVMDWQSEEVDQVYFYSAGVNCDVQREKLKDWLSPIFTKAEIYVESNLLSAARAIYGTSPGLIGILGTSSNSGFYDGKEMVEQVTYLGYLLADEGSGNALGKRMIAHYLRKDFSPELEAKFEAFYPDHEMLLTNVYESDHPADFFASFVPFIILNKNEHVIRESVNFEIGRYFELLRDRYPEQYTISLMGTLAHSLQELIMIISHKYDFTIEKILKSTIDPLTAHHQAAFS
ncbi:MAG: hypothetical protein ABFS32_02185 [Bacteroidota bacterium]